jgi:acetylornithine/succinyldiaminopimelate/putrescine aminotransferase
VRHASDFIRAGLDEIQALYSDFFVGIRQNGVIMGLEFDHPEGAKPVMRRLYENGVWAIFSTLDPRVLQFKPGILITEALSEELLSRVELAIGLARRDVMGKAVRKAS